MITYNFQKVNLDREVDQPDPMDTLNALGLQGWELISVVGSIAFLQKASDNV